MRPTKGAGDHASMGDMPRSDYTPPDDAARLFTRHKRAVDTQAELKKSLREMAVRELREGGATVGDLARLTGLSSEFFRRLAREAGIERLREPTVGRLKGDDEQG